MTVLYTDVPRVAADLRFRDPGVIADGDGSVAAAIAAATTGVNEWCRQRFHPDDAPTVRYHTASDATLVVFSDEDYEASTIATDDGVVVEVDRSDTDVWHELPATAWRLGPRSAEVSGRSYRRLSITRHGTPLPLHDDAVRITARYGRLTVPSDVETATRILAAQLWKRTREAHFGVVQAADAESGAVRVIANDRQVSTLLEPYKLKHL